MVCTPSFLIQVNWTKLLSKHNQNHKQIRRGLKLRILHLIFATVCWRMENWTKIVWSVTPRMVTAGVLSMKAEFSIKVEGLVVESLVCPLTALVQRLTFQ